MRRAELLHLTLFLFGLAIRLTARETGLPFIRNFPSEEYKASQQNWAIAENSYGLMYFSNNDGILEYDGVTWRLVKLPGVRSMAMDSTGIIYAGLENDVGYLKPDRTGNWQFFSLKEKIPEAYRDITTVFSVIILGDRVLFQDQNRIYIYRNETVKVLSSEGGFHRSFLVKDSYYTREPGRGLLILQNDSLHWMEGSELFATERIYAMLPFRQNEILLATRSRGLMIFSPEGPGRFYKPGNFREVDDFLIQNQPYCGTILPGGDFAVGTSIGGILIFGQEGKIKGVFDKKAGLQDNTVFHMYADCYGQLWTGLDNGISLIQRNLPFRRYTEQNGINGTPIFLCYFNDRFYAGTGQYLHFMNPQGFFERIPGTIGQNFYMVEASGKLLLANNPGIIEVRGTQSVPIPNTGNIVALTFSTIMSHPGKLITGAGDGLYLLENSDSQWKLKWKIHGFDKSSYLIKEDGTGFFWIGSAVEMFRAKINPTLDSVISVRLCTMAQGLPGSYGLPTHLNSGEVVFGTDRGIYRYVASKDRFEPHPDFPMLTGKVTIFKQEKRGNIWFEETLGDGNYERGILHYQDGRYIQNRIPFNKFTNLSSGGSPENVCFAPDGTIFFGIPSGFLAYNPGVQADYNHHFYTLIRKVLSRDSLIYGDAGSNKKDFIITGGDKIPYAGRDMTFYYASTFYDDPEKTLYSYHLKGVETFWSGWSSDHKKEYTNLPEGHYTFEVRSKNQYQAIGSTASWTFTILPPWYRTWWAITGYLVLLGSFIYLVVYFRTRKLKARSRELEKIVEQRTAQIQMQKNNVEQLSHIGKNITSSLSIENIIHTAYESINNLMDASAFTIGLYKPEENSLEFPATIEKGILLPPFSIPLPDETRLGAWCFNHRQEVIINDFESEYGKYVGHLIPPIAGEVPHSILYLPLWNKEKVIGVMSTQSFIKNTYNDYHVNILRNLATYSAIALENADTYRRLAVLLEQLKSTQDKLVTQSKLAALGILTAGIAHEIKNPLNFINNFAGLNVELTDDLQAGLNKEKKNLSAGVLAEIEEIISDLKLNAVKIQEHGKRADSIVLSMLQHSRGGSGEPQATDINAILEEAINLTYHGMRAQDKGFNIKITRSIDESIGKIRVIPQEISRAFLNIISNGCYEAYRKKLEKGGGFSPELSVTTQKTGNQIKIAIRDNGHGIPEQLRNKLFTPFFTTKPAGQGTGLGLSITWDIIVQQHQGRISFETEEGENSFAEFIILLPSDI